MRRLAAGIAGILVSRGRRFSLSRLVIRAARGWTKGKRGINGRDPGQTCWRAALGVGSAAGPGTALQGLSRSPPPTNPGGASRKVDKPPHGGTEIARRNRLRNLSAAATSKRSRLVARHREGVDRDDRNRFQLLILRSRLGRRPARIFRELEVHEDQVRSAPACEFQGLHGIPPR